MENVYELSFLGKTPPKKSHYRVSKNGGLHIDPGVKSEIDWLCLQVPGYMRDLKLRHPEIEVFFDVEHGRIDRDGMLVTLLDVLQNMGVLRNDNILECNGSITIHPARITGEWKTTIILRPTCDNVDANHEKPEVDRCIHTLPSKTRKYKQNR